MAKAIFHKGQRVFVKPVGTWAIVHDVVPHWVKDVAEPLRVTYELGLGRDFTAGELVSEASMNGRDTQEGEDDLEIEHWRVFRMKNRWQGQESSERHPYPGTFPVVMTDEQDWGGWRVPGAEYDRDPNRIEHQARMISTSPHMTRLIRQFAEYAGAHPENMPNELMPLARRATSILRHIFEVGDASKQAAE
ncbi:MAG: hypothetical protein AAGF33_12030 [Pseudomonadota bacterium]